MASRPCLVSIAQRSSDDVVSRPRSAANQNRTRDVVCLVERSVSMRRRVFYLALLALVGAGGVCAARADSGGASRSFQFRYRAVVKEIPAGAGKVEVWLPFPTSDAHQTINAVTIDAPRPVTISREPEYGNSILYVRVDNPTERQIPIEM